MLLPCTQWTLPTNGAPALSKVQHGGLGDEMKSDAAPSLVPEAAAVDTGSTTGTETALASMHIPDDDLFEKIGDLFKGVWVAIYQNILAWNVLPEGWLGLLLKDYSCKNFKV